MTTLFPTLEQDLEVWEGSRFRLVVEISCDWEPNFTGWTATMFVKQARADASPTLADLSAYVTVISVSSQILVDIPANAAEIQGATWGTGTYEIVATPAGGPDRALRFLQGKLLINKKVTP